MVPKPNIEPRNPDFMLCALFTKPLLILCTPNMRALCLQSYFQRVLSSKTPEVAQMLSIFGGMGALLIAVPPTLIGAIGYSVGECYSHGIHRTARFPNLAIQPVCRVCCVSEWWYLFSARLL